MNRREFLFTAASAALATQSRARGQTTTRPSARPLSGFLTDLPDFPGNVLLGRPTDRSITLNVYSAKSCSVRVYVGEANKPRQPHSAEVRLTGGEPVEIVVNGLKSGCAYTYDVRDTAANSSLFNSAGASFQTARAAGTAFTFTIQADSHLDDGCRTEIYRQTLENQLADQPDFMIDMGDTSMAGKHPNRESALKQFHAQRYYFGLIGHSVPSFLVLGNHDGEEAKLRGATDADGLAVWSNQHRKRFFSNPIPDKFYSGNDQPHPHAGLLQNYYSWEWGDALFVVLDPYWTSTASRGASAGWKMSLGRRQYDWLAATLKKSNANHKMVFTHQLLGGLDDAGRGGAEAADFFEWGGREFDGRDTFAEHRPGWAKPIHQLLIESGVNLVVHGHDHFFADQMKDGVHYLLAPQAAHRNYRNDHAAEYKYRQGKFLPNSGHLRVRVQREELTVEYVRSVPDGMNRRGLRNGEIASSVQVKSGHN